MTFPGLGRYRQEEKNRAWLAANDLSSGGSGAGGLKAARLVFDETPGSGVYTATLTLDAGAQILGLSEFCLTSWQVLAAGGDAPAWTAGGDSSDPFLYIEENHPTIQSEYDPSSSPQDGGDWASAYYLNGTAVSVFFNNTQPGTIPSGVFYSAEDTLTFAITADGVPQWEAETPYAGGEGAVYIVQQDPDTDEWNLWYTENTGTSGSSDPGFVVTDSPITDNDLTWTFNESQPPGRTVLIVYYVLPLADIGATKVSV